MIVGRFLEMLKHTIDEVSSLKGRQALCGALVTACLLSILIPIIHGFSLAVTSDTALPLISGCAVLAFVLTALTVLVYLNLRY